MKLMYSEQRRRYELSFRDYIEYQRSQGLPRRLGFYWDPELKAWHTTDTKAAAQVADFGDRECKERLKQEYMQVKHKLRQVLSYEDGMYTFRCPHSKESIPRLLAFDFDRRYRKWYTCDEFLALQLIKHADESAKDRLLAYRDECRRRLKLSRATDAEIVIPSPDGLNYLPFQRAGIAFIRELQAALIGDEMGLGKTVMALGLINLLADELGDVLVVCPASLKINWRNEAKRWLTAPAHDIQIAGTHFPRRGMFKRLVIINYDVLQKHQYELTREPWGMVIADEAHRVKNPKTIRTQAFVQIPAERKLLLTGTPIVNRPSELWPLLNYLDPDTYGQRQVFLKRYCGGKAKGAQHLKELQQRLRSTLMIRRLKSEVLTDLPPKLRQVIELPADEGVLAHERLVLSQLGLLVEGEATSDRSKFAEQVNSLRQGSMGAAAEIARIRHETALAKVPQVIEHVQSCLEQVDKVLLFAHHKDVVAALMAAFDSQAVKLTGDDNTAERQQAVERFQGDSQVRVFVGSITAAGVGLTLTAASHVVFAELDWVPGNMSQAEDRCHRIGQLGSVTVQHLVLSGSLDAYISRMLIDKQEVIDRSLDRRESRKTA